MKRLIALLLAFMMCLSVMPAAFAADTAQADAEYLHSLGLFQGVGAGADGKPNFDLDRAPNRYEAVTMLVRLLGKEKEALAGKWTTPFTDLAAWAEPYVGYAYAKGLTSGVSSTQYGGKTPITATQYLTFVLRALGYSDAEGDFKWNAAWELSDKIGLTQGQFNSKTTQFLRGDAASVSRAALDVNIQYVGKPLREIILTGSAPQIQPGPVTDLTLDDYLARKLSDGEIAQLKTADLDTVRAKITTLGDAVAWMDSYGFHINNSFGEGSSFGWKSLYEEAFGNQLYATEVYTALCGYLICDDYQGVRLLVGNIYSHRGLQLLSGLCLPVRSGYQITGPAKHSAYTAGANSFADLSVSSLAQLKGTMLDGIQGSGRSGYPIENLFLADAGQELLSFAVDDQGIMTVNEGQAQHIYTMSQQEKQDALEQSRLDYAARCVEQVTDNWGSYGLPAEMAPTMTFEQAGALYGKPLDQVAAAVKTFGDCIYYLAAAGFKPDEGGDLQTQDVGALGWHYNYAPAAALARNQGNCGAASALAAALLKGDYDQAGVIGMTFRQGEGGGHCIAYIQKGGKSYVFDMVNLLDMGFSSAGLKFTAGSTLAEAAAAWRKKYESWSDVHVRLMFAAETYTGDIPMGWAWEQDCSTRLSEAMRQQVTILLETPAEGYTYQFVPVDPAVQADIDLRRTMVQ